MDTVEIKCCLFSNCCGKTEDHLRICCHFCKEKNCLIRCLDTNTDCKYCVEYGFHKHVKQEDYDNYIKTYKKQSKKDVQTTDARHNLVETAESEKDESIKKRGRRKKLTEDVINSMTKDQCKRELDNLKIRYLYKNTLPQLRQMLIDSIKEK